jgi:protein SMG9
MFITQDRFIYLDTPPVLCNHFKKDFIVSEMDDIKTIMLLLNSCHILIIVLGDDFVNINLIRLLLCAEMISQFDRTGADVKYPTIVFVRNKAKDLDYIRNTGDITMQIFEKMFKNSKLNIYRQDKEFGKVNLTYFPEIANSPDEDTIYKVREFRRKLFMTPRSKMFELVEGFNEKLWSQIIINCVDQQNNNYFLRKYENLKEKYNLHNHVNVGAM